MPRLLFAVCALFVAWSACAEVAVPPLTHRVTDLTGTLTADQTATLEQSLIAFEAKKGAQIAALIVPTTQPEEIEQYSIRVAEQWKLGRKGVDDGVLLLVAKDDHRVRIEVGYGLEGALPDVIAKRIVEEDIVPRFRAGDFYGGIAAGIDRITRVIDGEPLPPPSSRGQAQPHFNFESLLLVGFILVFVVGGILRTIFGRFIGAGIIGTIAALIAWFFAGALFVALIVGVIAFVFSLIGGVRGGYPSGWSAGGGGFGGGGFSGGGGGFGGGGASGSW